MQKITNNINNLNPPDIFLLEIVKMIKKKSINHLSTQKTRKEIDIPLNEIFFILQDYKLNFEKTLEAIEEEKQKLLLAEQRWMDSWNMSVEKVKQLF